MQDNALIFNSVCCFVFCLCLKRKITFKLIGEKKVIRILGHMRTNLLNVD